MNKKFIVLIILFVLINIVYFVIKDPFYEDIITISGNEKMFYQREEHKSEISVQIPVTPYQKLNSSIYSYLEATILNFKKSIKDYSVQPDFNYTLFIDYEEYFYEDIISIVFFIETYLGGAHPNHEIMTFSYDTVKREFIDIETLEKKDPMILTKLSSFSRKALHQNPKIVSYSMMMEGTKPLKENFSKFAFTNEGLLLYFERYQVAPYSSGDISIIVPYDSISLKTSV